jgi:hypothetical protein
LRPSPPGPRRCRRRSDEFLATRVTDRRLCDSSSEATFGLGGFGGQTAAGFEDSVYFSAVTYTSLGLGDYYPTRGSRLIAGVEALNGSMMIAWSASFTYLAMEKYWPMHRRRG